MLLILGICIIMVNACVGMHGPSTHKTWVSVACRRGVCVWRGGGGLLGVAEEVTEWYQLTFPCSPNSDRLKRVCTGTLPSVQLCLSNVDHMEEGFRLDYCEWSSVVFIRVLCHLLNAFVKCSSLYGPQQN